MPEQLDISGPHLQIAVFCEKVLVEQNDVTSLIRIIDRLTLSGPLPELPLTTTIPLTIVVSFKAGFYRGKLPLKIGPITPSGIELPAQSFPLLFEGDDERGVHVQANMTMLVKEEGLYWFDVSLGDRLMTRMPLRVVYQQTRIETRSGQ
jgi:hypothetical protein